MQKFIILVVTSILGLVLFSRLARAEKQEKTKKISKVQPFSPSKTIAAKNKRRVIEFKEQKIKGVRRIPLGSLVTKERSDVKTELILMRKSWKNKILKSTLWLDTPMDQPK